MTPEHYKTLQKEAGLTNQKAADLLRVTIRAIYKWRQGKNKITPAMQQLIEIKFMPEKKFTE